MGFLPVLLTAPLVTAAVLAQSCVKGSVSATSRAEGRINDAQAALVLDLALGNDGTARLEVPARALAAGTIVTLAEAALPRSASTLPKDNHPLSRGLSIEMKDSAGARLPRTSVNLTLTLPLARLAQEPGSPGSGSKPCVLAETSRLEVWLHEDLMASKTSAVSLQTGDAGIYWVVRCDRDIADVARHPVTTPKSSFPPSPKTKTDSPTPKPTNPGDALQGHWITGCLAEVGTEFGITELSTVRGHDLVVTTTQFASVVCAAGSERARTVWTATLSFPGPAASPAGAEKLDITTVSYHVTALTQAAATEYFREERCASSNWALGVEVDCTGQGALPDWGPLHFSGRVMYTIFQIRGGAWSHGDVSGVYDGSSDERRPLEFATQVARKTR